jgi:hypothetical protein
MYISAKRNKSISSGKRAGVCKHDWSAAHSGDDCGYRQRGRREAVLSEALGPGVFSVVDKPVDMSILREQLHRLFVKKYNRDNFAE